MANHTKPGLSLAHLNVGSLLAANKFEMLKMQISYGGVDFFGISESWLTEAIPSGLIAIKGYSVSRLDRNWGDDASLSNPKKGGGLVCYIRETIPMSNTKYSNLNCSCKDLELQWISLNIPNLRQIVILNAYRPPQGDYKKACKLMHDSLAKANLKSNAEIFLMGDLNIDLKNKNDPATKELMFTMGLNGLSPKITETTRRSSREGVIRESCIDHIFTNSLLIVESSVLDLNISDHMAVYIRRKKLRLVSKKIAFTGRSYRRFVKEDFQGLLLDHDWDTFYNSSDPNDCWNILENVIRENINAMCPQRNFRVKEIREAWITDELLEEINDKDNYLRIARNSGLEEDWVFARRERNRVGRLVRDAKATFVKEQQREHKDDPKKFWKTISSIIPSKNSKQGKVSLVNQSDLEEVAEDKVADYVNDFFGSIGSNLAKKISEPWNFRGHIFYDNCRDIATDFEEVLKLCKDIQASKSSGISDIASKIFKSAFLVLIPQLVFMFNLSFSTGIFPNSWKKATVIPLFKGGERTEVGNYRPISLLPLPGKLIEKIAHKRISQFLESNNILSDKQSGFRKGFSTASAVADFTDDLFSAINETEVTQAVFVDLRKAFDTVSHDILCRKLRNYGLRGKVLEWCTDYLNGRSQQTLVNNTRSGHRQLTYGVPQGSVLGPLFFIVYVNDLQHALPNAKVQLYADDTVIFVSGKDPKALCNQLQYNLNRFQKWCNSNKLTINPGKTKLVTFGTRNSIKKAKPCLLYMGGQRIQHVSSYKYLGFILDSTLSFKSQVADIIKKVMHKRILLSKIMPFITADVALLIYKTMVLPYFDYCDIVYCTACSGDLDKLQRLQNKCLKTCLRLNVLHNTVAVHRQAKCATLPLRRQSHLCNFMYQRQNRKDLLDTRDIKTRQHDAPTFTVRFPNKESFKRSVLYNGPTVWNQLPPDLRQVHDFNVFKSRQKKMILG